MGNRAERLQSRGLVCVLVKGDIEVFWKDRFGYFIICDGTGSVCLTNEELVAAFRAVQNFRGDKVERETN